MKRAVILGLIALSLAGFSAAEEYLFYPNKDAVLRGGAITASPVSGGILVPASSALGPDMYVGSLSGTLSAAELSRLDNTLGVALIKVGGVVTDPNLTAAHTRRAQGIQKFLPVEAAPDATVEGSTGAARAVESSTAAMRVLINGLSPTTEPIVLPVRFKKSKIKVTVLKGAGEPVWKAGFELEADPKLSFWKEGRPGDMNDVPRPQFSYENQFMFKPFRPGDKYTVPVEIYYIKQENYVLNFLLTSSKGDVAVSVPIRFEEPSSKKKKEKAKK